MTEARGTYDELASEYYQPARHPTCANFREASSYFLRGQLSGWRPTKYPVCDVGAGKSLLAEVLAGLGLPVTSLVAIDSSSCMLAHSLHLATLGARLIHGDALTLPFSDNSVELLVSSLGDPYNFAEFWREVSRVLRPGALAYFTTPAFDWASSYRDGAGLDTAEFKLEDGRHVCVPSFIYAEDKQICLIEENSRLSVEGIKQIPVSSLKLYPLSPKLGLQRGPEASVVTGYVLRKSTLAKSAGR